MSPKKRASKQAKKKRPTKAMLRELSEVFERHNWNGVTIRLSDPGSLPAVAESTAALANADPGLAPTPGSLNCTPPTKPTFVCKTLSDGTIVCGFVCR